MAEAEKPEVHITPYRTYLYVLGALIVLTFTSVGITRIYLGALTAAGALIISAIKSTLVLRNFMHLKTDIRLFSFLVVAVATLICAVIILTLLDYLYR
jgi:cytochrome c oxidase subunit IV